MASFDGSKIDRRSASSQPRGVVSFGVLNTRNPFVGYMKHAPQSVGSHASRVLHGQVMSPATALRNKVYRNNVHTGTFHVAPGTYTSLHNMFRDTRRMEPAPTRPGAVAVAAYNGYDPIAAASSLAHAPDSLVRLSMPPGEELPYRAAEAGGGDGVSDSGGGDGFWYAPPPPPCVPATPVRALTTIGRGLVTDHTDTSARLASFVAGVAGGSSAALPAAPARRGPRTSVGQLSPFAVEEETASGESSSDEGGEGEEEEGGGKEAGGEARASFLRRHASAQPFPAGGGGAVASPRVVGLSLLQLHRRSSAPDILSVRSNEASPRPPGVLPPTPLSPAHDSPRSQPVPPAPPTETTHGVREPALPLPPTPAEAGPQTATSADVGTQQGAGGAPAVAAGTAVPAAAAAPRSRTSSDAAAPPRAAAAVVGLCYEDARALQAGLATWAAGVAAAAAAAAATTRSRRAGSVESGAGGLTPLTPAAPVLSGGSSSGGVFSRGILLSPGASAVSAGSANAATAAPAADSRAPPAAVPDTFPAVTVVGRGHCAVATSSAAAAPPGPPGDASAGAARRRGLPPQSRSPLLRAVPPASAPGGPQLAGTAAAFVLNSASDSGAPPSRSPKLGYADLPPAGVPATRQRSAGSVSGVPRPSSSLSNRSTPPLPAPPAAPAQLPPVVTIGRTGVVAGPLLPRAPASAAAPAASALPPPLSSPPSSPLSATADSILSVRVPGAGGGQWAGLSSCSSSGRTPSPAAAAVSPGAVVASAAPPPATTQTPLLRVPPQPPPPLLLLPSPNVAVLLQGPGQRKGGGGSTSPVRARVGSFRALPGSDALSDLVAPAPPPAAAVPLLRHQPADAGDDDDDTLESSSDLAAALQAYTLAVASATAAGGAATGAGGGGAGRGGGAVTEQQLRAPTPGRRTTQTPSPHPAASPALQAQRQGQGAPPPLPEEGSAPYVFVRGGPEQLTGYDDDTAEAFAHSAADLAAASTAPLRVRLPPTPPQQRAPASSVTHLIAWAAGSVAPPMSPTVGGPRDRSSSQRRWAGDAEDYDDSSALLMSPLGTPETLPVLAPPPSLASSSAWGGGGGGGNPYSMLPPVSRAPLPPLFGPGSWVKHGPIEADYALGKQIGDGGFAVVRLAAVREAEPPQSHGDGGGAGHAAAGAAAEGCGAAPAARGHPLVVKCVRKQYLVTAEERDSAVREVEIHRSLGPAPPRIVPLFDAYEDAQHVYLVMQAAAGGDLASYVRAKCVRQFSEIQTRVILDQLLEALDFLHGRGVLHADVKPHNVLIAGRTLDEVPAAAAAAAAGDEGGADALSAGSSGGGGLRVLSRAASVSSTSGGVALPPPRLRPSAGTSTSGSALTTFIDAVKLCDFGTARRSRDARYYGLTGDVGLVPWTSVTGTAGYIAPEILQRRHYSSPVDLWSVGILMYECLAGFSPFYPYSQCLSEPAQFPPRPWAAISDEARDLCRAMLQVDPARRITASQARAHQWFAKG